MPKNIQGGLFKGFSSSVTDILPCPRCNSLRSRKAPSYVFYELRYQCKDCDQYYRFDTRSVEYHPEEWKEREKIPNLKTPKSIKESNEHKLNDQ